MGFGTSFDQKRDANGNLLDENGNPILPGGAPVTPNVNTAQMFAPGSLGSQLTGQIASGATQIGLGNNNQIQGGAQTGAFQSGSTQQQSQSQLGSTTGTSTQQQQTGGTSQENQSGTSQTQQQGTNLGQTTNVGQTTTGVKDTLGFGDLLKGGASAAQGTDASRTAYLTDLMSNGGSAFQDQVKAATNQALSGPTMQGVGDSAGARAAGYAAANVARTNQDQRLNAAAQLAGPTATQTLASAGNPYLGSTAETANTGTQQQNTTNTGVSQNQSANTGATTGTSNASGTSNQLTASMTDLINQASSSGTSNAQNAQAAYGTTPSQTTSGGGGGSVICTVLGERGLLPEWMLIEEIIHIKSHAKRFHSAAKGYLFWGEAVARLARRNKFVAYLCLPLAKACAYEASRRARKETLTHRDQLPKFFIPIVAYWTFFIGTTILGQFIPGKPKIKDPELLALMSRTGLEINLGE